MSVISMYGKYRRKPTEIVAYQWHGINKTKPVAEQDIVQPFVTSDADDFNHVCEHCKNILYNHGQIKTLEGWHIVCPTDWVVHGTHGEFYPVKDHIFKQNYEQVAKYEK